MLGGATAWCNEGLHVFPRDQLLKRCGHRGRRPPSWLYDSGAEPGHCIQVFERIARKADHPLMQYGWKPNQQEEIGYGGIGDVRSVERFLQKGPCCCGGVRVCSASEDLDYQKLVAL